MKKSVHMKSIFIFLLISSGIVLHAQKQADAIVKTDGDTVWCDKYNVKFNMGNKVKSVECTTGKSVTTIDGKEVAFIIGQGRTELIGPEGYDWGEVIIWGKNYYLTIDNQTDNSPGAHVGDEIAKLGLFDKNREFIK